MQKNRQLMFGCSPRSPASLASLEVDEVLHNTRVFFPFSKTILVDNDNIKIDDSTELSSKTITIQIESQNLTWAPKQKYRKSFPARG